MPKFQWLALYSILMLLVLTGCNTQITTQTRATISKNTETHTPTPVATFTPKPTSTDKPTVTMTPLPTQVLTPTYSMAEVFKADEYVLETTITIFEPGRYYYQIQSWDNTTRDWTADNRITIKDEPFETIMIENARLGELPQTDITGEGDPDILIYGWGARLANPVYIYNLGNKLTRVFMSYRPSNYESSGCPYDLLEFEDLDNDGVLEILTCDAAFGAFDCGPSMGPMPLIVYAYDSELMQYNIVNPLFPEIYSETIEALTKLAEESPERKCIVSDLLLNYFYSGQIEKGWSELYRIYSGQDVDDFRKELENLLESMRKAGRFVLLEDLDEK